MVYVIYLHSQVTTSAAPKRETPKPPPHPATLGPFPSGDLLASSPVTFAKTSGAVHPLHPTSPTPIKSPRARYYGLFLVHYWIGWTSTPGQSGQSGASIFFFSGGEVHFYIWKCPSRFEL